jgi:hypothetical protein
MKKLALLLLAVPLAGCGLVARSPAPPRVNYETTVCWNAHGYAIPQEPGPCPPCWFPEAPAVKLPLGTIDECGR